MVNRLRSWYRERTDTIPLHIARMLLLLTVLMGSYVGAKLCLRPIYESTALQVGVDAITRLHQVVWRQGELRLEPEAVIVGSGYDKLDVGRGVLAESRAEILDANARIASAVAWFRAPGRWNAAEQRLVLPAERLSPGMMGALSWPCALAENEWTLDAIERILQAPAQRMLPPAAVTPPGPSRGNAGVQELLAGLRPPPAEPMQLPRAAVQRFLAELVSWNGSEASVADGSFGPAVARELTKKLHGRLKAIIAMDSCCFWLFGCWRWLEIVAWCWFGVIGQALIGLGLFAMGWMDPGKVWKPRVYWLTLAQLAYVPLTALGIFWLWNYATAGEAPIDAGRSSPVILGYALILGLFPDLAYNLLRVVADRLLKGSYQNPAADGGDKTKQPGLVVVSTPPQAATSVDELQRRVVAIAGAPWHKPDLPPQP